MAFVSVPAKQDFDWLRAEMVGFIRTQRSPSCGPVGKIGLVACKDGRIFHATSRRRACAIRRLALYAKFATRYEPANNW
jgi:hypothetical protein